MAVAYMHIPTTWNTFLPPNVPPGDQTRRVMMCGRKARYRLSGIPGVTDQPAIVNANPGWCPGCIMATVGQIAETTLPDEPHVRAVYNHVDAACKDAAYAVVDYLMS